MGRQATVYAPPGPGFSDRMLYGIERCSPRAAQSFREGHGISGVGEALSLGPAGWRQVDSGGKIFSIQSNLDILLRCNFQRPFRRNDGFVTVLGDVVDDLVESTDYYNDFRESVAAVPKFAFVALDGGNGRDPSVLTAVERVKGSTAGDFLRSGGGGRFFVEVFAAMSRFMDHQETMMRQGKKFPFDVHTFQFMYGRTGSDAADRLYFIDVEDRYARFNAATETFTFNYDLGGKMYRAEEPFAFFFQTTFTQCYDAIREAENLTGRVPKSFAEKLIEFSERHSQKFASSLRSMVQDDGKASGLMGSYLKRKAMLESLCRRK